MPPVSHPIEFLRINIFIVADEVKWNQMKYSMFGKILHCSPSTDWLLFIFVYIDPTIGSMQGIYSRALQGNASAENAASFGKFVEPLASTGLKLALQDQ